MGDYGLGPGGLPGTNDIVWRNATSGTFVVWYMDQAGNRTFGTFTCPTPPPSPGLDHRGAALAGTSRSGWPGPLDSPPRGPAHPRGRCP